MTVDEFDSWVPLCTEFVKMFGCCEEPHEIRLSVFRSHLSLEMLSVLSYALDLPATTYHLKTFRN